MAWAWLFGHGAGTNPSTGLRAWARSRWTVAALVLGISLGLLTYWHSWTDRSRRVLREIEALNGLARASVDIESGIPGTRLQFGPLEMVYLLGPQTDDEKLKVLDDVPRLRTLKLTNTRVTDAGLARLARFRDLNCLYVGNIDHTKLIGPNGAWLATRPLTGGKGLAALHDLPKLKVLQLYGPGTSDDDLKGLVGLKHLRLLDLMGTRVTKEGVAELKKALPGCGISLR